MAGATDTSGGPTGDAIAQPIVAEPRQRWRLIYARDPIPSEQAGRVVLEAWHACLSGSGLPVAGLDRGREGRPRIAFAAPLPAAVRGAAELVDIWLLERVPRWVVREGLELRLPAGHHWLDAEDVWLGGPALASRVVAAEWRIQLAAGPAQDELQTAAERLLSASAIPRVRLKGTTEKRYDLRPLLAHITVEPGAVMIRTRFDAELGAGRPDEVLAALGEAAGRELTAASMVRERLILADDAGDGASRP